MWYRLKLRRFDWMMGKHSGYPTCDIVWFLLRSMSGWPRFIGEGWRYRLWVRVKKIMSPDVHYVRCPVCVLRRQKVDVHKCTQRCRYELRVKAGLAKSIPEEELV